MTRPRDKEFPVSVKKAAAKRAEGRCESVLASGDRCPNRLIPGCYHFDHDKPVALGGEPTLSNCVVRCTPCHKMKTATQDMPVINRANRQRDALQYGIKPKISAKIPSAPKAEKPGRDKLPLPPRRSMFA